MCVRKANCSETNCSDRSSLCQEIRTQHNSTSAFTSKEFLLQIFGQTKISTSTATSHQHHQEDHFRFSPTSSAEETEEVVEEAEENSSLGTATPKLISKETKTSYALIIDSATTLFGSTRATVPHELHFRLQNRAENKYPLNFVIFAKDDTYGYIHNIYPYCLPRVSSIADFQTLKPEEQCILTLNCSYLIQQLQKKYLQRVQQEKHGMSEGNNGSPSSTRGSSRERSSLYFSIIVVATVNNDFVQIVTTFKSRLQQLQVGESVNNDGMLLYYYKFQCSNPSATNAQQQQQGNHDAAATVK